MRAGGVSAWVTEDGTATITAHGVAPEDADAAVARVDRPAHQVRRAGHPGRLDQIRVDLFVEFLDGRLHTLTDEQIITALLRDAARTDPPTQPPAGAKTRQPGTPRPTPTRAPAGQPPAASPHTGGDGADAPSPGTTQPPKSNAGTGAGSGDHARPVCLAATAKQAGAKQAEPGQAGAEQAEPGQAEPEQTGAEQTQPQQAGAEQAEPQRVEAEKADAEQAAELVEAERAGAAAAGAPVRARRAGTTTASHIAAGP